MSHGATLLGGAKSLQVPNGCTTAFDTAALVTNIASVACCVCNAAMSLSVALTYFFLKVVLSNLVHTHYKIV
jgi:hypothetical protein